MRVRIHRGASQIGGTCVEVAATCGDRIVLDVGLPLSVGLAGATLPAVPGLSSGGDPSLLGVLISHPHQDHWGLLDQVAKGVPVFMGEDGARILREAAFFGGLGMERELAGYLKHRQTLSLGPFTVTPLLVDHSAYDAYALLIEADGQRLFYTGDLRAHGRKAALFEQLLRDAPPQVDTLLMEGTQVRPGGASSGPSEEDLVDPMAATFAGTEGIALVAFSAQNIDRLVTVYKAARRAGRELVLDLYAATVAAATGNARIPQAGWKGIRVWLPLRQRIQVKESGQFERLRPIHACRVYPPELATTPGRFVLLFRSSMIRDLERVGALTGASLTWSLWSGYLREPSGQRVHDVVSKHGMRLEHHHSSGHAWIPDLQRLVAAMAPKAVVPIHTFAPASFAGLFPNVRQQPDGIWWEVA